MFRTKNASSEIAASMQSHFIDGALEKQAESINKFAKALDYLNSVAEIFDELGMSKEADATTILLEIVAAKKKKSKSKSKSKKSSPKSKSKKTSPTKGLTSEKMVDNLKEKGWVFNADDDFNFTQDDGHHDSCMCSMCMDGENTLDADDDFNFGNDSFPYDKEENEQDLARRFHDMLNDEGDDFEDDESGSNWDRPTVPASPAAKRHRSIDDFDF